jgi:hypothetical protein
MLSTLLVATMLFATKPPPDPFPAACVDCHFKSEEGKDALVSTLLKKPSSTAMSRVRAIAPKAMKLRGKHPPVGYPIQALPAGCTNCHSDGSKAAPKMAPMIHAIHLHGAKNEFVKEHGLNCQICHKLDDTAAMRVPSAAEK